MRSAVRALQTTGADVKLSADFDVCLNADGLVVPGVGAFAACMRGITRVRGQQIIERRLAGGRHVLGICVGMQVMFEHGDEHGIVADGLGQWPGEVEKLQAPVLPHMGWNTVEVANESLLFSGVEDQRFYFVHSYAVKNWTMPDYNERLAAPKVTYSEHGERFVAAVENGTLSATQFHPEKSGEAGLQLLTNWVKGI